VFSQDTAALSHEIGEWMDDPFVDNRVPCSDNSIMEIGDPLVLDDHAYAVGGSPITCRIWSSSTTSEDLRASR